MLVLRTYKSKDLSIPDADYTFNPNDSEDMKDLIDIITDYAKYEKTFSVYSEEG